MFVDLYAIQNVPPSNINRDDTGSPKTAVYGGSLRARVSSQAWKRSIRQMFQELLPQDQLGVRTKLAVSLIAERIASLRPDLGEEAEDLAQAALTATGVKVKASARKGSDEGSLETDYLIFIAQSELDGLAGVAISWADAGKNVSKPDKEMRVQISQVFHGKQAVDIALFGRMLADAPDLNTDASCQVAHAISVDRVTQEYDYFTAVDDCTSDDNAGAGMLGTVEFNSSTLYRYATINVKALEEQLGDSKATIEAVKAFADAFARSMPTGKSNTFANRTLPSTLLVAVRDEQPVNLVAAFEDPVKPADGRSVSAIAEQRLAEELEKLAAAYGMAPSKGWVVSINEVADFGERVEPTTLEGLLDGLADELGKELPAGEE